MASHLTQAIELLKRDVLTLSTTVEETVHLAVKSVLERDVNLAEKVIERDDLIDRREVEIEEECLKMLALYQPVAIDLRFIIAVLKINNDLERIADLATNVAGRAATLSKIERPINFYSLEDMAERAKIMLRQSLEALIGMDGQLARKVWQDDIEVDNLHKEMYRRTREEIQKDPKCSELMMQLLSISRNLERIADLATNVAEDVIYMVEGEIVRHKMLG